MVWGKYSVVVNVPHSKNEPTIVKRNNMDCSPKQIGE